MSDNIIIGSVSVFPNAECSRAQAIKVLEESAEVFEAVDSGKRSEIVSECADVIQSVCNLLAGLGVYDLRTDMMLCEARNRARGRYGR